MFFWLSRFLSESSLLIISWVFLLEILFFLQVQKSFRVLNPVSSSLGSVSSVVSERKESILLVPCLLFQWSSQEVVPLGHINCQCDSQSKSLSNSRVGHSNTDFCEFQKQSLSRMFLSYCTLLPFAVCPQASKDYWVSTSTGNESEGRWDGQKGLSERESLFTLEFSVIVSSLFLEMICLCRKRWCLFQSLCCWDSKRLSICIPIILSSMPFQSRGDILSIPSSFPDVRLHSLEQYFVVSLLLSLSNKMSLSGVCCVSHLIVISCCSIFNLPLFCYFCVPRFDVFPNE